MNTIAKKLLSTVLVVWSVASHAGLTLDTQYLGLNKEFNQLDWNESKPVDIFRQQHKEKIKTDLLTRGEIAPTSLITWGANGHAHAVFNGKDYYLRAFNYQTAEQDKRSRADVRSKVIPGGGACVLYVNDKDLNTVASLKVSLPENNFGTWCNSVQGIGSAGKGRDGVLIALTYYLTGTPPAKSRAEIGNGWRYMTVLVRLAETDGKLTLTQDDRCLGNPNPYKNIPSARKALARCEGK